MFRILALALLVSTPALAADDLGDLGDLPEAEVTDETAPAADIDLSDEDDFEFETTRANPVPATPAETATQDRATDDASTTPTQASFAPQPDLPSVDHVDFEDDFTFETGTSAAKPAPAKTVHVEILDLDDDVESAKTGEVDEEEARPELELDGLDDLAEEGPTDDGAPVEDVRDLLSDEDDIDVEW